VKTDATAAAELRKYLEAHVTAIKHFGRENPKLEYQGIQDFILREGRDYTEFSADNFNGRYRQGIPRYCFHNAYLAAVRSRERLRYVEGYALGSIIPVHHAWNIDPDGRIVDVTWVGTGDNNNADAFFVPTPGRAYRGVVFPVEYVREIRNSTSGACVLDNWEQNYPLLRQKWVPLG
jgi:hypothetical protein